MLLCSIFILTAELGAIGIPEQCACLQMLKTRFVIHLYKLLLVSPLLPISWSEPGLPLIEWANLCWVGYAGLQEFGIWKNSRL